MARFEKGAMSRTSRTRRSSSATRAPRQITDPRAMTGTHGVSITWIGLGEMFQALTQIGQNVDEARQAACAQLAQQMEEYAKANAPWQDQSGDARAGLHAWVEEGDLTSTVHLAHSVDYGAALEFEGFPIIFPTIIQFTPEVREQLIQMRPFGFRRSTA